MKIRKKPLEHCLSEKPEKIGFELRFGNQTSNVRQNRIPLRVTQACLHPSSWLRIVKNVDFRKERSNG